MSTVLTVLRVDADARHAGRVRALVAESGGADGEPEVIADLDAGRFTLVAGFHLAGDAAAIAARMAGALVDDPPRVTLSTGEVEMVGSSPRGPARERVDALAACDQAAPVVMTASTAVMVTHALPPGVELVDLGLVGFPPHPSERAYELRSMAADPAGNDDVGTSNLGWAHRAAARLVVGRDGPLARLDDIWQAVRKDDHRVVVLSGDPGIGKTTIAAELALRVHAGGGTVLYGRWDEEGLAPYQAVREALGTYAAASPRRLLRQDVVAHADELARLLPDIGARIGGVRPPLAQDPDAERMRLFDAVRDWLGAISRRRPLLLVLDDLQWADRSSLLLLRHLLDSPPEGPVLVVLTLRDGEVEGMGPLHTLGSFEGDPGVERIDVEGLDEDAVAEMVAQTVGSATGHDGAAAAQWLTDETAGNPLFVHEILRGLDRGDPAGALVRARDRLPERVHDVVRWRLGALTADTNDTLAAASFVGEEFSLDVLATTLERQVIDLRVQLDDAVRAGVVRESDSHHLAFTHAVVRRALQDDIEPARAADLHRRIADALADGASGAASAAAIAHHYLRAADADTAPLAVRWGRAAADQARRETAFEGAVSFLHRVVDVHDRYGVDAANGDGSRARDLACELRLDLAEAHDRAGEFIARDRRHLEAAELARDLGRTDHFTRAAMGYGGRLPAAPPPNPTARRLLDEALLRLSPTDSRARALTLARLAHVLHADAPHDERKVIADEAEAMARRLDAPVVLASVLASRVLALDGPDDVDEHLDIGAEVIRIGEQTGDADLVLQGARARIHPLFVVGAHDAARDLADTFADLAATVRHPDHLRLVAMWRTMWAALEGRFDEAEAQADQLRVSLDVSGHSQVGTIHFVQTFVVRWMLGTLAAARPMVEAGRHTNADAFTWWVLQAWVEAGCGDLDAARAVLAEKPTSQISSADAGYLWMFAVVGAAVTAASVGDERWAEAIHDTLAPYSGRNCVLGYAAYLGAVDHHLGTLDAVLGRTDDAAAHLDDALERHRVIEARPWVALSAGWLANVLAGRDEPGDADRAASLHAEATALAAALGVDALPPPHPQLITG
ncbi:MAG TPA: AAA family ATPase [Acidimicrobiales bacterium]|nr:AAA family ATPase [Acidimicrobiales bacterium]